MTTVFYLSGIVYYIQRYCIVNNSEKLVSTKTSVILIDNQVITRTTHQCRFRNRHNVLCYYILWVHTYLIDRRWRVLFSSFRYYLRDVRASYISLQRTRDFFGHLKLSFIDIFVLSLFNSICTLLYLLYPVHFEKGPGRRALNLYSLIVSGFSFDFRKYTIRVLVIPGINRWMNDFQRIFSCKKLI